MSEKPKIPELSTRNYSKLLCDLAQVCGTDNSGLVPMQFLSRPTTAKDIALLFYCTKYLMEGVEDLQRQYSELWEFVNYYFDNLDVQEEINNKINDMIATGQFKEILDSVTSKSFEEIEQEISVINARLSEIEENPGSTSGDLALNDIKIGYDGTVYDTPGDAVREQVRDLHTEFDSFSEYEYSKFLGESIYNKDGTFLYNKGFETWETGQKLDEDIYDLEGGVISAVTKDPKPGEYVCVMSNGGITTIGYFALYDESKTNIGYIQGEVVEIPENCKYVRFYFVNESQANAVQSIQPYNGSTYGYEISWYGYKYSRNDNIQRSMHEFNEGIENYGHIIYSFNTLPTIASKALTLSTEKTLYSDKALKLVGTCSATYKNVDKNYRAGDVLCLFMWLSIESGKDISELAILINGSDNNRFLMSEYIYRNGWNCIKLIAQEDTLVKSLTINCATKTGSAIVYLDSILVNFKYNPKILINFDNCIDTNLYGLIYPIMKEFNYPGTFSWQSGSLPDDGYSLSSEHFKEMLKNGWDYAVYDSRNQSYDALKKYLELLAERGVYNPTCYFNPANVSTSEKIAILKRLGFKFERVSNADPTIPWFDKNSFDVSCFGPTDTNLTNTLKYIDEAIQKGSSLGILIHNVTQDGGDDLNFSVDGFRTLLTKIKEYSDQGKCEVINFSEFYGIFYPSDMATYKNETIYKMIL